jgi:hypothetical protein
MPKKRPSVTQISARQRRIVEYIGSGQKSWKQAAKDFGVTPRELKQFAVYKSRKQLKQQYNRSPTIRKLYQEAETKPLRQKARSKGFTLRRFEYRRAALEQYRITPQFPATERSFRVNTGELIRNIYRRDREASKSVVQQALGALEWATYTRDMHLPVSIRTINDLHDAGELDDDEYEDAVKVWKDVYGITT